jgi:hypothetical protein
MWYKNYEGKDLHEFGAKYGINCGNTVGREQNKAAHELARHVWTSLN